MVTLDIDCADNATAGSHWNDGFGERRAERREVPRVLPNIVDEFVLPKLLLLRVVLVALTILLLLRWFSQGAIAWRRTPLDVPLLAFVGAAVLATLFAINRNLAIVLAKAGSRRGYSCGGATPAMRNTFRSCMT